ncbi:DNA-binding protein [Nocardioides jishulii]|uniref:DNA-binding protein n=1 Tax=Nocardioides jishulii TaxID=2575440 RepID=A0A4U2YJS8_9ACTN|nr:DNA-binding protein [Nocardioides jishulii]QCX27969.1 DNA-binding protein [Nocardioides jishulii]TKI60632.1 DNA-binding protein [Nocardioides jishulii]
MASDLPRIGAPATRALAAQGVHTLAQVAELTRAEVAAWHGVGPRAIRLLEVALEERGLHFS